MPQWVDSVSYVTPGLSVLDSLKLQNLHIENLKIHLLKYEVRHKLISRMLNIYSYNGTDIENQRWPEWERRCRGHNTLFIVGNF